MSETKVITWQGESHTFNRYKHNIYVSKDDKKQRVAALIDHKIILVWKFGDNNTIAEAYHMGVISHDNNEDGAAVVECLDDGWKGSRDRVRVSTVKANAWIADCGILPTIGLGDKFRYKWQNHWYNATVVEIGDARGMKLHFSGYNAREDLYVDPQSGEDVLLEGWA